MSKYKFIKELNDVEIYEGNGTLKGLISFKVGDVIDAEIDTLEPLRVIHVEMVGSFGNTMTIPLTYLEKQPDEVVAVSDEKTIDLMGFFTKYKTYFYIGGSAVAVIILIKVVTHKKVKK